MQHSEQINEIAAALAAAQGEFKAVAKDKTAKAGAYSYKYSDIADVLAMALPVLSKHKLALVQATDMDGGAILLRTRLAHASGQWVESVYPVCDVRAGDHQKMGGALTYARRYAVSSLLGIASEEDTDAQEAAPPVARGRANDAPARKPPQQRNEPKPGDKGATAALLHAIGLCESEAELNAWYQDDATKRAMSGLAEGDFADVRASWAARRKAVRQQTEQEAV
ncbi:ERF family protein [Xanthobacter sp. TB0136]|uniref:ERF family protein n=1 Tax=Xanthobacter sp. TB0136 TaxID=3459177 RepID=UPI00403A4C4A